MENVSFSLGRALWAFLLAVLGSATGQPLGGESVCTARPLARYSITFTGKWSQTAFPKQYPLFRPPAQWSTLLGKGTFPPSAPSRRLQCLLAAHFTAHSTGHSQLRNFQHKRHLLNPHHTSGWRRAQWSQEGWWETGHPARFVLIT